MTSGIQATPVHADSAPSEWVLRWAGLVSPPSQVLDLAGGMGRHAQVFADRGCRVTLADRSEAAMANARHLLNVTPVQADLENQPWPFQPGQFDAIVVTHYLWRALFANILASLRPGGLLIYETFARGQETIGRPSDPEFLLERGELLRVCTGLHVLAYEDLRLRNPDRFVQRICARRD
jgi:SAM-dependent methyltransferase